jgi:predicted O-methyltransferase YrrM
MEDLQHLNPPSQIQSIDADSRAIGFDMPSAPLTCALLRTLAASKPQGKFLEIGSGTGLSTAWILDGMDAKSQLITIDYQQSFLDILNRYLGCDPRLKVICGEGDDYLKSLTGQQFDLIFADAWSGKYQCLDEALALLKPGGIYAIDDMLPQPNWPDGHTAKVNLLISILEDRKDLQVVKMSWASGIILATKI